MSFAARVVVVVVVVVTVVALTFVPREGECHDPSGVALAMTRRARERGTTASNAREGRTFDARDWISEDRANVKTFAMTTSSKTSSSSSSRLRGGVEWTGALTTTFAIRDDAFDLIVDTGSALTYLPCVGCAHCGKNHEHEFYDYRTSPTFEKVTCANASGRETCATTLGGKCSTSSTGVAEECAYEVKYAEGSKSDGYFVRDEVDFGGGVKREMVSFGCETKETNAIYDQKADGVMGFSRGTATVHAQLAQRGVIENAFGMCVEGFNGGGMLTLGKFAFNASASPTLAYADTSAAQESSTIFHVVRASSWAMNGVELTRGGYDTIIDSGTTFTYVPMEMFNAVEAQLAANAKVHGLRAVDGPDPEYDDICYSVAGLSTATIDSFFPKLVTTYVGVGGTPVNITLGAENYMFQHELNAHAFCLGIFAQAEAYILMGQITMRDVFIEFDITKNRIGMGSTNCTHMRQTYLGGTAAGGGSDYDYGDYGDYGYEDYYDYEGYDYHPGGGTVPSNDNDYNGRNNNHHHGGGGNNDDDSAAAAATAREKARERRTLYIFIGALVGGIAIAVVASYFFLRERPTPQQAFHRLDEDDVLDSQIELNEVA